MSGSFQAGDIVIDGGNSYYEDSIRRYKVLKKLGVSFLDMGTSGGLIGARTGASLMIGGERKTFKKVEKLFLDLAMKDGYAYLGPSGAGHFVKTVHNGVEYALLEAYGEGFGVLEKSKYNLDMKEVSKVWAHGSVIRSWIMDLAHEAFQKNPKLNKVPGVIGGGTTGKWALKISKKMKADSHTLEHALKRRKVSKRKQNFASKFIAEMRNKFGGHKLDRS
jgi:6-phosphogluconate dehydrogenase